MPRKFASVPKRSIRSLAVFGTAGQKIVNPGFRIGFYSCFIVVDKSHYRLAVNACPSGYLP